MLKRMTGGNFKLLYTSLLYEHDCTRRFRAHNIKNAIKLSFEIPEKSSVSAIVISLLEEFVRILLTISGVLYSLPTPLKRDRRDCMMYHIIYCMSIIMKVYTI